MSHPQDEVTEGGKVRARWGVVPLETGEAACRAKAKSSSTSKVKRTFILISATSHVFLVNRSCSHLLLKVLLVNLWPSITTIFFPRYSL